ncbi:MAG: DUF1738 domain-containing protein [Leptospiraceae bacterium]|nr:DUF1738 domain-containing protein [Leptospiraceae bacterium]
MSHQEDFKTSITEKIIEQIKSGNFEKYISSFKRYGIPRNGVSKKMYKGGNFVNLSLTSFVENYPSNDWFTFLQAKEQDGRILKGEHGTQIIFYNYPTRGETYTTKSNTIEKAAPIIKVSTVFNRSQTSLPALEATFQKDDTATIEDENLIKEFISNIPHDLRTGEGRAFFESEGNQIFLPGIEDFSSLSHYYSVYFHELTHLTGIGKNLNRECFNLYHKEISYRAKEELIAELGSAFLCGQFGVNGKLNHTPYIATWLHALENDINLIFDASRDASKAIDFLNKFTEEKRNGNN